MNDTLPSARSHRGRVRVVFNPVAGSRGLPTPSPTAADLEAVLDHVGVEADIVEAGSEDEGRAATGEAVRAGYEVVVAAGGDGTIGMVATELLGTATALGILPIGSIMNIPRSLGIPRDLPGAAAIVATGIVVPIDVGEARGRPFFESGSVGMNAAMFREAERFQGGERRSLLRTLWVAFRYRPARMRIELDDRIVRTRALTLTVSNGPYTGAGMTVAPDARLDDGRFDIRVFERFSKWELVRHLASIAFGRRQYVPRVSTYRSRYARISSAHPLPARADSRDLGTTPAEFRVRPSALRVVVAPGGLPDEGAAAGSS
ncbi:MAG TPA: diacylglycerol kinase family protein [Candidatus Limnocylindrales bacterium]|nr:diacylglycerol kinase family protein [Candidatus Limnocylindrales bacterium]